MRRVLAYTSMLLVALVLAGCGGSSVPKDLRAPPQEPATPDNAGDGPAGFAQPMSPL